jgi:hypothetical protein
MNKGKDLPSLYVNDIPVPSRHVEVALYADDTAITATSRSNGSAC